jgi:hypothetical protein
MERSQVFDYNQSTRDSLAGIYVEACDESSEQAGRADTKSADPSAPPREALFGLTLTVDDSANAK